MNWVSPPGDLLRLRATPLQQRPYIPPARSCSGFLCHRTSPCKFGGPEQPSHHLRFVGSPAVPLLREAESRCQPSTSSPGGLRGGTGFRFIQDPVLMVVEPTKGSSLCPAVHCNQS